MGPIGWSKARLALLAGCVLAGTACAPMTRYRQTLYTAPAAPPPTLAGPIAPGEAAVGGSASGFDYSMPTGSDRHRIPEVGDPGLLLPAFALEGYARLGVMRHVEVGVSGLYAPVDAGLTSAIGVLPVHGGDALLGVMPAVKVGGALDDSIGLHASFEAGPLWLPYTRYELDPLREDDGDAAYDLTGAGVRRIMRYRFTNAITARAAWLEGAVGASLTHQPTNVGFSEEPQPIVDSGPPVIVPSVQVGTRLGLVGVAVQAWVPIGAAEATGGVYDGLSGRVVVEVRPPPPAWAPRR